VAIATSGDSGGAAAAVPPDRSSASAPRAIEAGSARAEPARTPEELCEAACRSGCGIEGPECARYCRADPRSVHCLQAVGTSSCDAWARCVLGASCSGEAPRGEASCGDTFACERSCHDNIACGCSCLGRMDSVHAVDMTRLSMCALFMCANDA